MKIAKIAMGLLILNFTLSLTQTTNNTPVRDPAARAHREVRINSMRTAPVSTYNSRP